MTKPGKDPPEKIDISFVEQKYSFTHKEKWVKKGFMIVMGFFLTLGLLGLFGSGFLSETILSANSYSVEYQKFLRQDTPSDIYISLDNPPDTAVVSLPNSYIKHVHLKKITPAPESVEIENQQLRYSFVTNASGVIAFKVQPEKMGIKELELDVSGEQTTIRQYIYF